MHTESQVPDDRRVETSEAPHECADNDTETFTVRIVSGTIQEFRDERYYLCGFYYQRNGKRLHRALRRPPSRREQSQ